MYVMYIFVCGHPGVLGCIYTEAEAIVWPIPSLSQSIEAVSSEFGVRVPGSKGQLTSWLCALKCWGYRGVGNYTHVLNVGFKHLK